MQALDGIITANNLDLSVGNLTVHAYNNVVQNKRDTACATGLHNPLLVLHTGILLHWHWHFSYEVERSMTCASSHSESVFQQYGWDYSVHSFRYVSV